MSPSPARPPSWFLLMLCGLLIAACLLPRRYFAPPPPCITRCLCAVDDGGNLFYAFDGCSDGEVDIWEAGCDRQCAEEAIAAL